MCAQTVERSSSSSSSRVKKIIWKSDELWKEKREEEKEGEDESDGSDREDNKKGFLVYTSVAARWQLTGRLPSQPVRQLAAPTPNPRTDAASPASKTFLPVKVVEDLFFSPASSYMWKASRVSAASSLHAQRRRMN